MSVRGHQVYCFTQFVQEHFDIRLSSDLKDFYIQIPRNGMPNFCKRKPALPWYKFKEIYFNNISFHGENYNSVYPETILSRALEVTDLNCWRCIYDDYGSDVLNFIFHKCRLFYKSGNVLVSVKCSRENQSQPAFLKFIKHVAVICDDEDYLLGNFGKISIEKKKLFFFHSYNKWPKRSLLSHKNLTSKLLLKKIISSEYIDENFSSKNLYSALQKLIDKHKSNSIISCKIFKKFFPHNEIGRLSNKKFVRCIKAMVIEFVPPGLVGGKRNLIAFGSWIKKLLSQPANQTFTVNHMVFQVFICDAELKLVLANELPLWLLARIAVWLTEDYIFSLIHVFFYVNLSFTQELYVHTAKYWRNKEKRLFSSLIKAGKLIPFENSSSDSKAPSHIVRFLPKPDSNQFRPLIYTKKKSDKKFIELSSVLLKQLIRKKKSYINNYCGRAANDLEYLWPKLAARAAREHWKLYYIKVDIADAFGSVSLDLLKSILIKDMEEISDKDSIQALRFHYKSDVFLKPYYQFKCLPITLKKGVAYEDNRLGKMLSKKQMLNCLIRHIDNVTVKIRYREGCYKLAKGLPQGGQLSSLLCDLYFSTLDEEYLYKYLTEDDLFLRAVDDYLFVTPSKEKAKWFKARMERGFSKYGVSIKPEKTLSSFKCNDVSDVPYFGYSFNMDSLQVVPYFSIFMHKPKIINSVSYKALNIRVLERRMTNVIGVKLSRLVLNPLYNTKRTLFFNISSAGFILAMRYASIAGKLLDISTKQYLYCALLGVNSIAKLSVRSSVPHCISYASAKYLAIRSFITVLRKSEDLAEVACKLELLSSHIFTKLPCRDKKLCTEYKSFACPIVLSCY